jgi:phosphohistidine phosphatase
MSKRIIVFRHGKSDWAEQGSDHDRPLNKRGQRDAKAMGRALAAAGQVPEYVLYSSARRASTTLELAAQAGRWPCPQHSSDELYETRPQAVLALLHEMPRQYDSVMLVGHEPTWSQLTSLLIGGGNIALKTATMACVEVAAQEWGQVEAGTGQLLWLLQPKLLPSP